MNQQAESDKGIDWMKSSSALRELLAVYRSKSKTEREKGTYFMLLIRDFLKHDPTYAPNFSDVWTYAEWATLEYVVNGKPALEWVMERQAVTTHKESGIFNDANLWAIETMQDAAYPLKLFQRIIAVSLETMKIVKALPRLDIGVS